MDKDHQRLSDLYDTWRGISRLLAECDQRHKKEMQSLEMAERAAYAAYKENSLSLQRKEAQTCLP